MEQSTSHPGPLPEEWCRRHFDHLSPDLAATMPATMERMRELCPVARSEEHGGFWVVSGYEDVLTVAQDWETYSSAHGLGILPSPTIVRNLPVQADPPYARIFKRLVNPFFTPAAVAPLEAGVRALVNRLIDDFIESGECEFMNAFARPLPSLSFFEMVLNAPGDEVERVAYLASKASIPTDPKAKECWQGLYEWIQEFVARRREQEPRGDVVDAVVRAEVDGRPITDDEVIGTVQLIILGGLETTAGALGLFVDRFCAEPQIPALLREHPERINEAVLELLRLEPPFVSVGRTAVQDAELGGRHVSSGDKVLVHWASANRDAGEFPDPDRFDLDRSRNRHLSFGAGPHRCLGSNLARMNMRVALEELLPRLHDIRLAEGARVEYHAGLTRSPLSLPVTFTPGPRLSPGDDTSASFASTV